MQDTRWQRALIGNLVAQTELRGQKVWVHIGPPQPREDLRVYGLPRRVVNPEEKHYLTHLRDGLARIWLNARDCELLPEFAEHVRSEDIVLFSLRSHTI